MSLINKMLRDLDKRHASATLADGTAFAGLPGLKSIVLSRREQFVGTVTAMFLLIYSLSVVADALRDALDPKMAD